MGFRKDAYARIWEVKPVSDVQTRARISITRKDKTTGEFVDDFSGFVGFFGTVVAKRAAALRPRDRIKLGDVDVCTHYDKEKGMTYTNFKIYSFELQPNSGKNSYNPQPASPQPVVDDGEMDDSRLPF